MILVRALNNLDILGDPLENGIASKQMIYRIVKSYYDNSNDKEYLRLNSTEKDLFIKEHMEEYLRNHNNKIKNKYYKYSNQSREDVKEYCDFYSKIKSKSNEEIKELIKNNKDNLNFGSYITIDKYLSSLQQHLLYGSSKITDWISTSSSLNSIMTYYDNQDIHKVAVIKSNTGGLVDSDNILSVDLSNMDKIKEKRYLCNRIELDDDIIDYMAEIARIDPNIVAKFHATWINKTDINSRGFKYANKSREICILKYIPSDHIVAVLEALQIDLIKMQIFNNDFYTLNKEEQKNSLNLLKKILEFNVLLHDDPFMNHVFNELYIKNKNINDLINVQDSKEKVIYNKNKILSIAKRISHPQIKR